MPWNTSLYQPPSVNYGLGAQLNRFMTQQSALPYQINLPGYQGLVGQRSANIGGLLRGQVPEDVQLQMAQGINWGGSSRGIRGDSPNLAAQWRKALGITSLGLQQQGSQQLGQAIEQTPVPEIWNPLELYMSQLKAQQELAAASQGEKGFGVPGWVSPEKYTSHPWGRTMGGFG